MIIDTYEDNDGHPAYNTSDMGTKTFLSSSPARSCVSLTPVTAGDRMEDVPAKTGMDGTRSKSNELDAPPLITGGTINIGPGNSLHEEQFKITDNGGEVDGNGSR